MADVDPVALFEAATAMQPHTGDAGPDVAAPDAEAWRLFTCAAEAGHEEAMRRLVSRRDVGLGWAIALAKLGDSAPLATELCNPDWSPAACREVLVAAEAGEPWAQTAVGYVYAAGMSSGGVLIATTDNGFGWLPGVKKPKVEAERWFERAAKADWAGALMALAHRMKLTDPATALAYVQRAAKGILSRRQQKQLPALICDLLALSRTPMAQQLPARQLCVEQGHVESMVWLAERYRAGDCVERDPERALALFQAAADKGSVVGCRELGRIYEEGLGVAVDDTKAQALYEQAAELGADGFARDRLAEKYGLTWYARTAREKAKDVKPMKASKTTKAKPKAKAKTKTKSKKPETP